MDCWICDVDQTDQPINDIKHQFPLKHISRCRDFQNFQNMMKRASTINGSLGIKYTGSGGISIQFRYNIDLLLYDPIRISRLVVLKWRSRWVLKFWISSIVVWLNIRCFLLFGHRQIPSGQDDCYRADWSVKTSHIRTHLDAADGSEVSYFEHAFYDRWNRITDSSLVFRFLASKAHAIVDYIGSTGSSGIRQIHEIQGHRADDWNEEFYYSPQAHPQKVYFNWFM